MAPMQSSRLPPTRAHLEAPGRHIVNLTVLHHDCQQACGVLRIVVVDSAPSAYLSLFNVFPKVRCATLGFEMKPHSGYASADGGGCRLGSALRLKIAEKKAQRRMRINTRIGSLIGAVFAPRSQAPPAPPGNALPSRLCLDSPLRSKWSRPLALGTRGCATLSGVLPSA